MIEYIIVFLVGFVWGVMGLTIHDRTEHHLNRALKARGIHPGTYTGAYVAIMTVLLWPVLILLLVTSVGYMAVRDV